MIHIPVALTNPGEFFACCGLLEIADRLWPGAEGWFASGQFHVNIDQNLAAVVDVLRTCSLKNTMTDTQTARLDELSTMPKKVRDQTPGLEDEKKVLEALRRESPILLLSPIDLRVDWFLDDDAGGSRFKTWAGQQSVLDIATAMHAGVKEMDHRPEKSLGDSARQIGLPFNFDSDLGGQGSALDVGFSFDPLAASEATRIEGSCKPTLELLSFIGLQRFRPRELPRQNRFVYAAWQQPLPPAVAAAAACQAIHAADAARYEFRLLYRTKYLKSFLPAIPFQGDDDE